MGLTSENVAQRFGITRTEQDQAAVSWRLSFLWHVFDSVCELPVCCLIGFLLSIVINCNAQVESHMKAASAAAAGKFKEEIVPVHTKVGLVFFF